jgi:thiol:disulfide interchange protein DsbC
MNRILSPAILLLLALPLAARASCKLDQVNANVSRAISGVEFDRVKQSPARGLCEATIGMRVFYVSEDGKFLFAGSLVSLKDGENVTASTTSALVRNSLARLDESEMIIMGPKKAKHTMTVFTDVDCPYCALLHREVPELTRNGVRVRYLLFPHNGLQSPAYRKSVAVWCAPDRVKAIGVAKAGGRIRMRDCPNPVRDIFRLGQEFDVTGTPTIFLDDGTRIGGYLPARELLSRMGIHEKIGRAN